MFNYYQYEQRTKQAEQTDELHMLQKQKQLQKLVKERDDLSKKYRDRINVFVQKMGDEPVKINDEYKLKQIDDKFSPLKSGSDVAYKKFKYSYNHWIGIEGEVVSKSSIIFMSCEYQLQIEETPLNPSHINIKSKVTTAAHQRSTITSHLYGFYLMMNLVRNTYMDLTSEFELEQTLIPSVPRLSINHSDKERIERSKEVNSLIDTLPANLDKKAFLLRPREPEKEIGPYKLKFKASSSLERIHETLQSQSRIAYLPEHNLPFISKQLSPHSHKLSYDFINDTSKTTLISPKTSFLPALHTKTHFQAATALMMQYKNTTSLRADDPVDPNQSRYGRNSMKQQVVTTQPNTEGLEEFELNEPSVVDLAKSTSGSQQDQVRKIFNSTGGLMMKSHKPHIPKPPPAIQDMGQSKSSQIKKILFECNMIRTRSKKYERPEEFGKARQTHSSLDGGVIFSSEHQTSIVKHMDSKAFNTIDSRILDE